MKVTERFLKYVSYPTGSEEGTGTNPSTPKQLVLSTILSEELSSLGLQCDGVDGKGYVYATLPATVVGGNDIGFIAHVDTAPDAPDSPVRASVVEYNGEDIILNREENILLSEREYPSLARYRGEHLVVTDGKTLLGADDKAGIAEIMTMLERVVSENIPHGKISVAFTPDEEIGAGADYFDLEKFGADYAYTVDGGTLGEVEYETFNAAAAKITVNGVSIHPGSAKGKMKNAARILCDFNALLPPAEIPEKTEGYEGFHHMTSFEGRCESATASYIIRDHDRALFEEKKEAFRIAAARINEIWGEGTLLLTLNDSYYNMGEIVEKNMFTVDRARQAMLKAGVTPHTVPIRGGTDGARLSFMGLPCPNLSTGGENFHSRFEYVSVLSMEKMVDCLVEIVRDAGMLERESTVV